MKQTYKKLIMFFINTFSVILLSFFFGCTGKKPASVEPEQKSNIINLDDAFENTREVRLSDIADSVSFLPLETKSNSLIRSLGCEFSLPYIYKAPVGYFDWTGRYKGKVIKAGQGPYEEPGDGIYGKVLFVGNRIYSMASKLIEYDGTGAPTGKVRHLYAPREFSDNDAFRSGVEFFSTGKNLAIYGYPNLIYSIDTANFETISSRLVAGTDTLKPNWNPLGKNFITYYKDKPVFYNFMNDTIFYVTDEGLEPKWVISFTGKQRLPAEAMLIDNDAVLRELREVIMTERSGVSLEDTKRVKLLDKKHIAYGAYETDSYIFFPMKELVPMAPARGKEQPAPYIVIFDKSTHETYRVKGDGFVDDLTGMNIFYPKESIFDEKLISSIWPYELLDYIEECREAGRDVKPQLLALSKTVKDDDNPILILVHLKKK
jgi:hypothetical protein